MEDVLRGDGLAPYPGLGEGDVLRDARIEVVADHQHVEMLVNGVDRVGPCGVGGARQDVAHAAGLDDVRGMPAARALGMVGVDGAALERRYGVLDKARLIEGVGMYRDLHVIALGDAEAAVDCRGGAAPVLVELEAHGA